MGSCFEYNLTVCYYASQLNYFYLISRTSARYFLEEDRTLSIGKVILGGGVCLFAIIGIAGFAKKKKESKAMLASKTIQTAKSDNNSLNENLKDIITREIVDESVEVAQESESQADSSDVSIFPKDIDRIHRLFTFGKSRLPFVDTIAYTSRVSWLNGRPAWIADYASYFSTSRHFIARALNGKKDYYTQKVSTGDRFNVFSKDKEVEFYSVLDLSKFKLWFYAFDKTTNERILLKTYPVAIGRTDTDSESGSLSPIGRYKLGEKIAIYKPGVEGYFKDQKIEMIQVFGTRWIPLAEDIDDSQPFTRGIGVHGAPWRADETTGELIPDINCIGKHVSSGCIRLSCDDMEEFFSIVVTKPTVIDIVKTFEDARLPGVEWVDPIEPQGIR